MRELLFNPSRLIARDGLSYYSEERDYSPHLIVLINLTINTLKM